MPVRQALPHPPSLLPCLSVCLSHTYTHKPSSPSYAPPPALAEPTSLSAARCEASQRPVWVWVESRECQTTQQEDAADLLNLNPGPGACPEAAWAACRHFCTWSLPPAGPVLGLHQALILRRHQRSCANRHLRAYFRVRGGGGGREDAPFPRKARSSLWK